jgi:hypothetical protein
VAVDAVILIRENRNTTVCLNHGLEDGVPALPGYGRGFKVESIKKDIPMVAKLSESDATYALEWILIEGKLQGFSY